MAKYIYGKMFDWIVHRTNEFLGQTEPGYSFVGACVCVRFVCGSFGLFCTKEVDYA